jgi:hypothetical protein
VLLGIVWMIVKDGVLCCDMILFFLSFLFLEELLGLILLALLTLS